MDLHQTISSGSGYCESIFTGAQISFGEMMPKVKRVL